VAGLSPDKPGQYPDNHFLSGDTLPGQTRTPPYKGVQLSGVRTVKKGAVKKEGRKEKRFYPAKPLKSRGRTKPNGWKKFGARPAVRPAVPILPAITAVPHGADRRRGPRSSATNRGQCLASDIGPRSEMSPQRDICRPSLPGRCLATATGFSRIKNLDFP
jgi:hypothetical protein